MDQRCSILTLLIGPNPLVMIQDVIKLHRLDMVFPQTPGMTMTVETTWGTFARPKVNEKELYLHYLYVLK